MCWRSSLCCLLMLLLSACATASIKKPRRFTKGGLTIKQAAYIILKLNPQAEKRGWNWKKEYPRYYRPVQLMRYAKWVLVTAKKYKQSPLYIMAILQEQSRFQYDAVSKTQDFGMSQIHCGRRSPWCRYPPTRAEKKKLFNPKWSIDRIGQWLVRKQSYCRSLRPGSRMFRRCQKNKAMTGVIGTLGHPHKTRYIMKRIQRIIRSWQIPSS